MLQSAVVHACDMASAAAELPQAALVYIILCLFDMLCRVLYEHLPLSQDLLLLCLALSLVYFNRPLHALQ